MDSKIAGAVYTKLKGELPKIEIHERRIYPKEVYTAEQVLSVVGEDEKEFIEFIFKLKEGRLSRVTSTRKFKHFESAYIELFITFGTALIGGIAANAIWDWIRKRTKSARNKEVRTVYRVKISYRGQERIWRLEEPYIQERLVEIEAFFEKLTGQK